jgi:hypothetical protein
MPRPTCTVPPWPQHTLLNTGRAIGQELDPASGRSAAGMICLRRPPAEGLRVNPPAYCSGVVLVKLPLTALTLIWLLPKEMSCPKVAFTPVPLPPIVDEPTLTAAFAVVV